MQAPVVNRVSRHFNAHRDKHIIRDIDRLAIQHCFSKVPGIVFRANQVAGKRWGVRVSPAIGFYQY